MCFTIWTTSILTHARHRADSHESTPVRTEGDVRIANPRRKEQLHPLVRGLPPSLLFVPRLPHASRTLAISCPPHWWRAADIARAYLLKGLPWRLAVVVSQEERARESSIYCGESWRREKKRENAQTWAMLPLSHEQLPATQLGKTYFLPPAGVCLDGGEEFTQAPMRPTRSAALQVS